MSEKEEAIALIDNLPDTSTMDDIIASLVFKMKVNKGLEDINRGKVITHNRVIENMKKWASSHGQK